MNVLERPDCDAILAARGIARRPGAGLTFGHDAAWSGWGWCLGDAEGPLVTGHVVLAGRAWRWPALQIELAARHRLVDGLGRLRVCVERAPSVYRAAGRMNARGRSGAGNQADIGYGLGQLSAPLLMWGTRAVEWDYPWEIEVKEWRAMWWKGPQTTGRVEAKRRAIQLVGTLGWESLLPERTVKNVSEEHSFGDRGDVAEAILLTVGCARNARLAPRGPQRQEGW